jgi:hypothetical protein
MRRSALLDHAERELALALASRDEDARRAHYVRAGAYFDRFYRGDHPYEHGGSAARPAAELHL